MTSLKGVHGDGWWTPIKWLLQWVGKKLSLKTFSVFYDRFLFLISIHFFMFSLALFYLYLFGTLSFRFGKDFGDHLVLIWCVHFQQTSWPLVLYANTSRRLPLVQLKPYSLFFVTLVQDPHLRLSLLWQPFWTHFSASDIRRLTVLFLPPATHWSHGWSCCQ